MRPHPIPVVRRARRLLTGASAALLAGLLAGLPVHDAHGSGYGHGYGRHGGAAVSIGVRVGGGYRRGHRAGLGYRYGHRRGHRIGLGYRYGYRPGRHGRAGYRYRHRAGYGVGYAYRPHRHRGGISVHYSAPLVLPYAAPPAVRVIRSAPVVVERRAGRALPSMPDLEYTPQQGQGAGQATRDRRECERLAWHETRPDPMAGVVRTTTRTEVSTDVVRERGDPFGPTVTGTALGAVGGAIAGDAGAGAAFGALAGAAAWMLGGWGYDVPVQRVVDVVEREYVPAPGPDPSDLREALVLCMEARGYAVR